MIVRNVAIGKMRSIPFFKPTISDAEIQEVVATLKSGWLTTGPKVKQFECGFAEYVGVQQAVALNSCTAALHLALEAVGLQADDSVLVPSMTFAATAEVVRYFGARPILVDCREHDFNMDVDDAERRLQLALADGARVKAVIPVHFAGQIGDVAGIKSLAERYSLDVIEDAAHCCPAYFRDSEADQWQSVGSTADISCYSFYANKTITTGEGGMACTDNEEYADRMRVMSLHGISKDAWKRYFPDSNWYYEIVAPGYKYNMADIAACLGIHQLRAADSFFQRRRELSDQYRELLGDVDELILPREEPNRKHSWHLFVIRLRKDSLSIDRNQFITELKGHGIGTSVHFTPLHMHPYYRDTYGYVPEELPVCADLYEGILTLPLYPSMEDDDVEYVCREVRSLVARHRVCKTPQLKVV